MEYLIKKIINIKILTICLLVSTTVALYYETFQWLYTRYTAIDSYYSHGFLIPFVTLYLIWFKKDDLLGVQYEKSMLGFWMLVTSFIILFVGTITHFHFLGGFSFFVFIISAVLYLYGYNVTRKIIFPLMFLIFMIPLPLPIISKILFPMKIIVMKASLFIIRIIDIPVYAEGFRVHLKSGVLEVGNPCSGLRSMIAFLAMGSIVGYLNIKDKKKVIFLILISIPIAFLANISRTLLLIIVAHYYGIEKASPEYWLHNVSGLCAFIIGFYVLLVIAKYLGAKSE